MDPLPRESKLTRTAVVICLMILIAGVAVRVARHPGIVEALLDEVRNLANRIADYLS